MTAPLALAPAPQTPLTFDAPPDHLAGFVSVCASEAPRGAPADAPRAFTFDAVPPDAKRAELFDLALDLRGAGVEEPLVREIVSARAGPAGVGLVEDVLAAAPQRRPSGALAAARAALSALLLDRTAVESSLAIRARWALTGEAVQWDLRSAGTLALAAMDVVGSLDELGERIFNPPPPLPGEPVAGVTPAMILRVLRDMYGRWRQATPQAEHDAAGLDEESAPTRLVAALLDGPVTFATFDARREITTVAEAPGSYIGQGVALKVDDRAGTATLTVNLKAALGGVLAKSEFARLKPPTLASLLKRTGRAAKDRHHGKARYWHLDVSDLVGTGGTVGTGRGSVPEPVPPVPSVPARADVEALARTFNAVRALPEPPSSADDADGAEEASLPAVPAPTPPANLHTHPLLVWTNPMPPASDPDPVPPGLPVARW